MGLALALLYTVLVVSLAASGIAVAVRPSRRLWRHEWLLLGFLHMATAFLSGIWRQSWGSDSARSVAVAGMLQLLLAGLYPTDAIAPCLLAVAAATTTAALEAVVWGGSLGQVFDSVLTIFAPSLTVMVVGSIRIPEHHSTEQAPPAVDLKAAAQDELTHQLSVALCPILDQALPALTGNPELTTNLDRLVTRIMRTQNIVQKSKKMNREAAQIVDSLCKTLLSELARLSESKVYVAEGASPMTAQYIQQVLTVSETPASGMPANLKMNNAGARRWSTMGGGDVPGKMKTVGDLPTVKAKPKQVGASISLSNLPDLVDDPDKNSLKQALRDKWKNPIKEESDSSSSRLCLVDVEKEAQELLNEPDARAVAASLPEAKLLLHKPVDLLVPPRSKSAGLPQVPEAEDLPERPPVQSKLGSGSSEEGGSVSFERPPVSSQSMHSSMSAPLSSSSSNLFGARREDEDEENTFDTSVRNMMAEFYSSKIEGFQAAYPLQAPDPSLYTALERDLGHWRFDIFKLNQYCNDLPMTMIGSRALAPDIEDMQLEESKVLKFLQQIESRYVTSNPYHNSMHGADVMNSMIYFLKLPKTPFSYIEPVEKLAAMIAAGCHDVGHNGKANRFHITTLTPLAMLYNDQSPLENMHCAISFSVLYADQCNFLVSLEAPQRATFRNIVTTMILETDLAKHIQTVAKFRQDFLHKPEDQMPKLTAHTPAQKKDLLAFALKCSDVAHSTKPFDLHLQWTLRINEEFFLQGDVERELQLPCSPFCDRYGTHVSESQRGFFDFIVAPLYSAMDEHLNSRRLQMEVLPEMEKNRAFWKMYDGGGFNYEEPLMSIHKLKKVFADWDMVQRGQRRAHAGPQNDNGNRSATHVLGKIVFNEADDDDEGDDQSPRHPKSSESLQPAGKGKAGSSLDEAGVAARAAQLIKTARESMAAPKDS